MPIILGEGREGDEEAMIILVAEKFGKRLVGRVMGREHYAKGCQLLTRARGGEVVVFDFFGVEIITGSWFNAMIVPLYHWAGQPQNDLFPLLTNLQEDWIDDLSLVAEWNRQCYLVASGSTESPEQAMLVGSLDVAQSECFARVRQEGESTGAGLARMQGEGAVGPTAWNNRLKELYKKRLIKCRKHGKERVYFPVVQEILANG